MGPRQTYVARSRWILRSSALVPCLLLGAGVLLAGTWSDGPAPAASAAASSDLALELPPPSLHWERPAACFVPEVEAALAQVEPPPPEAQVVDVFDGVLEEGDTLFAVLAAQGVEPEFADRIGRVMRPVFDFRKARPGHVFRLVRGRDGSLHSFTYRVSQLERYRLLPDANADEWLAGREQVPLERRRARLAGVVSSTLYDAVQQLGEHPQLARDLADVFAWDVDFSRASQPGDEFRVVYERLYARDEADVEFYVGPGRILAARYRGAMGEHTALYFETEEGRGGYYRPDGSSVQRQFLVAPVSYTRISSSYSNSRFHPILKVKRPHHGIDYAAPSGTPVWSVADGRVTHKGWASGFGRLVKVTHRDGYVSYYAHLSRFADVKVGQVVRQKQVVGYVGSSGLATGPHVCFRVARHGRYVNPASLRAPAGQPVPPAQRLAFEFERDELLAALSPATLVVTDEAL